MLIKMNDNLNKIILTTEVKYVTKINIKTINAHITIT